MPWVYFTADHVKARLAVRELETYEETATAEDDDTPGIDQRLPGIVEMTLAQFRGKIRANPQVAELGPAGTLPDFCVAPASIIARIALIGMNPVAEGMTDPRRDEYRDAMKELEGLAALSPNAFALTDPSPPSSTAARSFGGSALLDF